MALSWFKKRQERPDDMLPAGWQFYSRPTNLEPPGTIFRVDKDNQRFIAAHLKPRTFRGPEPGSARIERIETKAGILARALSLQSAGARASAGSVKAFRFQIIEPVRESTTDEEMTRVLDPYLENMCFRERNRYYIIREARSATAMRFLLTKEELGEISGDAEMAGTAQGSLTLSANATEISELTQSFPQRLGVMFLAEEIAPVVAGLAAANATFGRIPVTSVLDWIEPIA